MGCEIRYKGKTYTKTANFELDTMIACEEFTPTQAEESLMKIHGKKHYIAKDINAFVNLCTQYGIREGRIFQTVHGPLQIMGVNGSKNILTIATRFKDPSKLPGKQIPYHFATPETHQTYSAGGSIYGWSFNGYSGKWNFHFSFSYGWHPAGALCEFLKALDSIRLKENAA